MFYRELLEGSQLTDEVFGCEDRIIGNMSGISWYNYSNKIVGIKKKKKKTSFVEENFT